MAGFLGRVQYKVDPRAVNVDSFRLVYQFGYVFRHNDFLILEVYNVEIVFVRRITVREVGIPSANEAALPDVYSFVETGDVKYVVIGQVNFSVGV